MNLAQLKSELAQLTLDERRQVTAYLVSLRHQEMADYRNSLAAKVDDDSPEKWVSFEEFDRRIAC